MTLYNKLDEWIEELFKSVEETELKPYFWYNEAGDQYEFLSSPESYVSSEMIGFLYSGFCALCYDDIK